MALGIGMWHWRCEAYQVCSNDVSKYTLTYLTSRSNLLPTAFKWEILGKVDCLILLNAPFIILGLTLTYFMAGHI